MPRILAHPAVRHRTGPLNPQQTAAVTFAVWIVVFLAVGWVWAQVNDRPAPAVDVPQADRTVDERRAADKPDVQDLLTSARGIVAGQPQVIVTSDDPQMTVRYTRHSGQSSVLITAAGQPTRGIDAEGVTYAKAKTCWHRESTTEKPTAVSVVLPLAEPSARFSDIDKQDGDTVLKFTAQQLGSFGAGSGTITFDDDVPTRFAYRTATGRDFSADVKLSSDIEIVNFLPIC